MIFQYQKTRKVIEILQDLIRIHNDRIACYRLALESLGSDMYLREMIGSFINEGLRYKMDLVKKIKQMDGDIRDGSTVAGKIYRVWMDLKVGFSGEGSRRSIIASCRYNEEILLQVYNAALIMNMEAERGICSLLEEHEAALRGTLNSLKSPREAPHFIESSVMYFN